LPLTGERLCLCAPATGYHCSSCRSAGAGTTGRCSRPPPERRPSPSRYVPFLPLSLKGISPTRPPFCEVISSGGGRHGGHSQSHG
jgi:hypothetical protein